MGIFSAAVVRRTSYTPRYREATGISWTLFRYRIYCRCKKGPTWSVD